MNAAEMGRRGRGPRRAMFRRDPEDMALQQKSRTVPEEEEIFGNGFLQKNISDISKP